MPELPEVETVKRGLNSLILGKVIRHVQHDTEKSFPNSKTDVDQFVIGSRIQHIRRRAKVLIIELSSGYSLLIHLKMTGQLVYVGTERFGAGHPNDSLIGLLPDRSTRVTVQFTDNSFLYFNDQRKFGWMKLIPTVQVPEIDFMKHLGPEPLTSDFSASAFRARLMTRQNSMIKPVLLDQAVLAGVGNIYADESLWAARIHPETRVKQVSVQKMNTLFTALQTVLRLSIEKGGSSDKNYVNAEGKKGSYITFAHVFRREGKPCSRCNTAVVKMRVAGRGTHICPRCQRLPE